MSAAAAASFVLIALIVVSVLGRRGRAGAWPGNAKAYGFVSVVLAVVAVAAVGLSVAGELMPSQTKLDDYQREQAQALWEEGVYLQQETLDDYGDSLRESLYWTGATGEEYDAYWEMIAAAETLRDGLFWKQHAQADPSDDRSARYWQQARQSLEEQMAASDSQENRASMQQMLERLA